jgi:hypothetical protein
MASCNHDIDELRAFEDKIPSSNLFNTSLHGFGGPALAVTLK